MDYSGWLDLVSKAGVNVKNIDPGWLSTQFSNQQSPALVAQQIRAGNAPPVLVTQQPSVPVHDAARRCVQCGSHDFFFEQVQVPREHGAGYILWLVLGGIVSLALIPIGGPCMFALILPFVFAYYLLSPKFKVEQRPRCKNCGFVN